MFNQTPILNRSSPVITYSNSSPIILSVSLELFVLSSDERTFVTDALQTFTSFTFPEEPGVKPPSLLRVTIPGYEKGIFDQWACVLTQIDCQSGNHTLYQKDGSPLTGVANLSLMGVEVENVAASKYLKQKNFRALAFRGSNVTSTTQGGQNTGDFGLNTGSNIA